jgi:1-acyl-sn-glycerol-3-phosphate acyltransferase
VPANESYSIAYPRRQVARGALRLVARALLPLLSRTEVTGREHFPEGGPLLVVGNHIAAMEVVLMVTYAPWTIELLGPGDIPPPPAMHAIARLHGYIPIYRGSPDRGALTQALEVLEQGGVVGLFPEGGIWDTGDKPAKRGVAWLSHRAQAPILPIGFGGVEGALTALLRLQRPRLSMSVGTVMPPVTLEEGAPRKDALRQAAARVMGEVERLIPPGDRMQHPTLRDERFELHLSLHDASGAEVALPPERAIAHAAALCKVFYRPAILDIWEHDLHMPVAALRHMEADRLRSADDRPGDNDPAGLAAALDHVLRYVQETNPGFLSYRFGMREGAAMAAGLEELRALARWAAAAGHTLSVTMVRRYTLTDREGEIVEHSPGQAHAW